MKIAIINDVHAGKPLIYGDHVRSNSNLVLGRFEEFLNKVVLQHTPDLIVNLGDLIRSEEKELDISRYRKLIEHYKSLNRPVIHLLGNHEVRKLNSSDIKNIWNEFEFKQECYGHQSINGFDIIWLGLQEDNQDRKKIILPQDQLEWLKEALSKTTQPTLIFSHVPLDDHNVNGNFFYETFDAKNRDHLFLKNQAEIRNILQSQNNIVAVFQAHLHYFHAHIVNSTPYITCPAMGDDIYGPNQNDQLPDVYTIVDLNQQNLVVKAYSNKYCFAGYEQQLKHPNA